MSKIEKLTEEQEALMYKVRDKWIQKALNDGDEFDQKKIEDGIAWMYGMTKMKSPKVIFVDSPLAVQYAANILLIENGQTDRNQVYDQVYGQVSDQVSNQVYGQVRGQVSNQVRNQVSNQVSNQVYDQVRNQVSNQVMTQFYWSYETLGWRSDDFAFFDFFYQIGVTQHEGMKKYLDYLDGGAFFAVFLTDYAIVCRRPQATRRDENNRLHNDQKPAIEWRDGYKLWYLHGVAFEEHEWKKIVSQDMTLEDLAKAGMGADKSAVAVQMLRPDLLLKHVKAELIHTGIKGTRLYKVKNFMGTRTTQYCMLMDHPTIERQYIEWVRPEVGKKADAPPERPNIMPCYAIIDEIAGIPIQVPIECDCEDE